MQTLQTDFITTTVHGERNRYFLQQLCTQNIPEAPDHVLYTTFLNNQGRVLWDAYIHFPNLDNAMIIHPMCQKKIIHTHLSHYAPFSKITLSCNDVLWNAQATSTHDAIKLPHMPYTLTQGFTEEIPSLSPERLDAWIRAEILAGIPRIRAPHSGLWLPLALEYQKLSAISFHKGCYLGQEITHRMACRGAVKKGLYRGYDPDLSASLILYSQYPTPLGLYVLDHTEAVHLESFERIHISLED